MKERPILMHARSIHGILDGRKTQTRRIYRPRALASDSDVPYAHECPYGQPGDRLWVREAFYIDTAPTGPLTFVTPEDVARNDVYYRADGDCCKQIPECSCAEVGKPKWRPSIHMPRWVSRLTLEIINIRVERIQDISEEDCIAEGCQRAEMPNSAPRGQFRQLWDDTNGAGAWDRNDWVWCVSFRRMEASE